MQMRFFTINFFSHLNMQLLDFKKIVFCSDDETGMDNAIESASGGRAVTTRCTRHLKRNLDYYLKDKAGLSLRKLIERNCAMKSLESGGLIH